jgi:hypothetical protein
MQPLVQGPGRRARRIGTGWIGLVVVMATASPALGKSKRKAQVNDGAPDATNPTGDAAFVFVKGRGLMRMTADASTLVYPTRAAIRDLAVDRSGAVWASLRDTGVVRLIGDKPTTVSKDSFGRLAILSPTDVWAINDSHGSVVHFDGSNWKTMRTRSSLPGAFADNRVIDIAADERHVWVASWNGLWRVAGGRWVRVDPPGSLVGVSDGDAPAAPPFPVSLVASRRELVACYLSGCFVTSESRWQPSRWPADKARLHKAGEHRLAGVGADGRTIVLRDLEDPDDLATSAPLPADGINDLALDARGRTWVATGAQLILLDDHAHALGHWRPVAVDKEPSVVERVVVVGNGPDKLPAPTGATP